MDLSVISMTLDAFAIIVIAVILLCVCSQPKANKKQSGYFILLCLGNLAMLAGDLATWLFDGLAQPWYPFALQLGILTLHFGGLIAPYYYARYVKGYLAPKAAISPVPFYIVTGFSLAGMISLIANLVTKSLYYIDAANIYHRGSLWWISQVPPVAITIISIGVILRYRRCMRPKDVLSFVSYLMLPIIAVFIQSLYYGLSITYPAITISSLVIFLNIHSEQALLLKQQEQDLEKSRIAMMLSQIQPHFLYNSLLGIKELCDTSPQKASDAMEHFSYFLRGNLDSLTNTALIPFRKELEHVEDYLYLEKMRYEERVTIQWETAYQDFLLPPLILQPIVENAVRHGITKKSGGGTVTIRSAQRPDGAVIAVTDDGVGFDVNAPQQDDKSHIGIGNARNRLEMMCGGKLLVASEKGVGTTVTMIVPQRRDEDEDTGSR